MGIRTDDDIILSNPSFDVDVVRNEAWNVALHDGCVATDYKFVVYLDFIRLIHNWKKKQKIN